ncbi:DUF2235 domain-containing protein [Falsihalocynthiibacter arcticus]|uniref:T6SS Phospholipase effector Tle1-like catalytic domain-containing protein n=1 Tax=Falsihalocynthiibacter arcticus TaxID=1579316 RepID=A0A126UZU0_9RHOB|nr:DUF2235 domain-containing protein [Falsihalocynthiibacter arcticus]AML51588.1 hypothetical protein RC74_10230 [Falsihalocynthiibacter arcticus]
MTRLRDHLLRWLRLKKEVEQPPLTPHRGAQNHVIILDGTLSSLDDGLRSNAGLLYKLLCSLPARDRPNLRYESGIQWPDWRSTRDVIEGRGINRQIRRTYGFLASRYHTEDRIYLFGYSRGAFTVRSLAGMIEQVGLLKPHHATERNIRQAYRLYQGPADTDAIHAFRAAFCHPRVEIEMVGVWETVKALGLPIPFLWRLTDHRHAFHSPHLGTSVRNGFQALALDETRQTFAPVMWKSSPSWTGHVEQMWFRGHHADIGGQLGGFEAARPLSNIPLVWMLEQAEALGLTLPNGWRAQFPCDVTAPSVTTQRRWGPMFVSRWKRKVGRDPSESIHPSVPRDHPQKSSLERLQSEPVS